MQDVSKLRKGIKIKINNEPCLVVDFNFSKPGKGQAVYRCKLKNLITQNSFENTWRSGDKFEKVELNEKEIFFSYIDKNNFIFLDSESYEEIIIDEKLLGEKKYFLSDDMKCSILLYQDKVIELNLPNFVEKEIIYTEPGFKGDTASSNVTKPAKITNDYEVQVPLFVNQGDIIKIDTRTAKYAERVNKKN